MYRHDFRFIVDRATRKITENLSVKESLKRYYYLLYTLADPSRFQVKIFFLLLLARLTIVSEHF